MAKNDEKNTALEDEVINDVKNPKPTMRERIGGGASYVLTKLGNIGALLTVGVLGVAVGASSVMLIDGAADTKQYTGIKPGYAMTTLAELADDVLDDTSDEFEDNLENGFDDIEDGILGVISREGNDEDRAEAVAEFLDDKVDALVNGARDRAKRLIKNRIAEARGNLKGPWYDRALAWVSELL